MIKGYGRMLLKYPLKAFAAKLFQVRGKISLNKNNSPFKISIKTQSGNWCQFIGLMPLNKLIFKTKLSISI